VPTLLREAKSVTDVEIGAFYATEAMLLSLYDLSLQDFKNKAFGLDPNRFKEMRGLELELVARHFGVPSPLMDWTMSPFVAKFFCCDHGTSVEQPAFIWRLNLEKLRTCLAPEIQAKFGDWDVPPISLAEEILAEFGSSKNFPLLFNAPYLEPRMRAQVGRFLIMANKEVPLGKWVSDHSATLQADQVLALAMIKPELKHQLRLQHRYGEFDAAFVFPDLVGAGIAITESLDFGGFRRHSGTMSKRTS